MIALILDLFQLDTASIKENASYVVKGVGSRCSSPSALSSWRSYLLALFGSLGRLSKTPFAYGLSGFYTSFFRGTPLIVQLFLIYFGFHRSAGTSVGFPS